MRMSLKTCLASSIAVVLMNTATAQSFVVTGVDFVGLSRVTPDRLHAMLPVRAGELLTDEILADSITSLYNTDQFSNVQAQIVGTQVVYYVTERPIIAELNFEGNKLIPKEGLEQGLKQIGLATGQVLKQSTVHAI